MGHKLYDMLDLKKIMLLNKEVSNWYKGLNEGESGRKVASCLASISEDEGFQVMKVSTRMIATELAGEGVHAFFCTFNEGTVAIELIK